MSGEGPAGPACPAPRAPDLSGVEVVRLRPRPAPRDQAEAQALAEAEARRRLGGEAMLLSWYDRDRDLEAPAGVSECHEAGAVPGWLDYGLHRGARLLVDVDDGRFQFLFRGG